MNAIFSLNTIILKLKEANYPSFWEEKVKMITDERFTVKRYVLDINSSEFNKVAMSFYETM